MDFDFSLFFRALGLALALEGLCWAVFPGGMRKTLLQILPLPDSRLRLVGLGALLLGALLSRVAFHF